LRVPLPKDLTGSGIFQKGENRRWPEAYFLMVRTSPSRMRCDAMRCDATRAAETE
jgi:hypothetical protein